jgi:hypothetical protein
MKIKEREDKKLIEQLLALLHRFFVLLHVIDVNACCSAVLIDHKMV